MKTKYEEKFIVINRKYLKTPSVSKINKMVNGGEKTVAIQMSVLMQNFLRELEKIQPFLPNNEYYVCNQDEPYAQKVIDIILEGEDK